MNKKSKVLSGLKNARRGIAAAWHALDVAQDLATGGADLEGEFSRHAINRSFVSTANGLMNKLFAVEKSVAKLLKEASARQFTTSRRKIRRRTSRRRTSRR